MNLTTSLQYLYAHQNKFCFFSGYSVIFLKQKQLMSIYFCLFSVKINFLHNCNYILMLQHYKCIEDVKKFSLVQMLEGFLFDVPKS
jgi:hypothetical protein